MKIPKHTPDEILEMAEASMMDLENLGICIACGEEHYNCEPDARKYKCEECGEMKVYGLEELVLMGAAT